MYQLFSTPKNTFAKFLNWIHLQRINLQSIYFPWDAIFYQMHFHIGYFPYSVSHSSVSPPLFLSFLPQYIFQTELSYSSVSLCSHKLGMGVLPQSLSARQRRQPLALKIFPIMQTDKGMLFKSPQPICWSLFIYKGLQAASPVKTILDTYARSLASCLLCFPLLACRIKYP